MSDPAIQTIGKILERKADNHFLVELMNGKVIHAHPARTLHDGGEGLAEGVSVILEMTPYDFDSARIKGRA